MRDLNSDMKAEIANSVKFFSSQFDDWKGYKEIKKETRVKNLTPGCGLRTIRPGMVSIPFERRIVFCSPKLHVRPSLEARSGENTAAGLLTIS